MRNPVLHPLQGDSPEEEDDQHDVGVDGGDVDDLGVLRDSLDDAQVDEGPGGQQTSGDGEVEVVRVLDVVRDVQGRAVPEVLCRAARLKRNCKGSEEKSIRQFSPPKKSVQQLNYFNNYAVLERNSLGVF